jgi:hypothetical protein
MIMSTITDSPSPNKITTLYVPRPNFATGEVVWGFWLTVDGHSHYSDWAMPTEQLVEMARQLQETAVYQYWMPYGDGMALRASEEPEATPETNTADDEVEIDGRAYQVTDRLGVEQLPARAARVWRRDGVVAHVEVRRPRGRRSYIARQYADGSFSRPWRGSLVAN